MDGKVIGIYDKDSNNLAYFHSDTPDSPFSNLYQPKNGFNLYAYNGKMQVAPAKESAKISIKISDTIKPKTSKVKP